MIALRIDFIAGRFHATPWQRAANDGDVEWPPAPWRIMRALAAGWFRDPVSGQGTMMRLFDRLAEPPRFLLPPATVGHTRHYMPQVKSKNLKPITTLTLDSFVRFEAPERTSAWVVWDNIELDTELKQVLSTIVIQVPYLGRAESWCRIDVEDRLPENSLLIGVDLASRKAVSGPIVQRLGPGATLRGLGLWQTLLETTAEMRKSRRRQPQGTVWLDYAFPSNFGFGPRPSSEPDREKPQLRRTERFLLEAIEPRGVRPSITDTARIAALMRHAAMKASSDVASREPGSKLFTGREGGAAMIGHTHAYFLPRDLDDDGRIDHIDVRLPIGGAPGEINALRSVTLLYDRWGDKLERHAVTNLGQVVGERARRWCSATPFIPPRHPKKRVLRGGAEALSAWVIEQVGIELRNHGILPHAVVNVWDQRPPSLLHRGGNRTRFDTFIQSHNCNDERRRIFGVDLTFTEAFEGPIAIGSEAHYGLGQFRSCDAK